MGLTRTLVLFPEEKISRLGGAPENFRLASWENLVRASASPADAGAILDGAGLLLLGPHYVGPGAVDPQGKLPDLHPVWRALAERITGPAAKTVFLLPGKRYRLSHRRKDDGYVEAEAAAVGHALKAVEYLVARSLPRPEGRDELPSVWAGMDRLFAADELVPRGELGAGLKKWLTANDIGCHLWLDVDEQCWRPVASYRHCGHPGALHIRYPSGARALVLPLAGEPDKALLDLIPDLAGAFEVLEAMAATEGAVTVIPVAGRDAVEVRAFGRAIRVQGMTAKLLKTLAASPGQRFASGTLVKHMDCASEPALEQQYKLLRTVLRKGGLSEEEMGRVIQAHKPRGAGRGKQYWMPSQVCRW